MEVQTTQKSPTGAGAGEVQADLQTKGTKINPDFEPLKKAETLQNINPFSEQEPETVLKNGEILAQLLEAVEPLDLHKLAFPQYEGLIKQLAEQQAKLVNPDGSMNADEGLYLERKKYEDLQRDISKLKLNEKHLLILPVEQVLKLAELNDWGLCLNLGFTYIFNGCYWAKVEAETLQKFLGEAAEKMSVAKYSARYFKYREAIEKQFICTGYLPSPEAPKNKVLINLKNGTFEVTPEGVQLRPFNRLDFITYQLPFEYNPGVKAPLFEEFLNKVLPDKERQSVLSEFLGYVFVKTAFLKLEKALLLYGTGANGKSVVYDIINALFGTDNITSYSLEDLTDNTGYYRVMIADKLLNYASEISNRCNPAYLKALISGEDVGGRLPYGKPVNVRDYAKLMFNLNELPKDVEHTNAFFRRLLIVPFEITIPEKEQDKQLAKKIIESELSGVFNWVLQGLERLLKNKGFTDCQAINAAREDYRINSDSVLVFMEENQYKPSPEHWEILKDIYIKYRNFCNEDGFKPVQKKNFIKRLKDSGVMIEKKNIGNVAFVIAEPPQEEKPF